MIDVPDNSITALLCSCIERGSIWAEKRAGIGADFCLLGERGREWAEKRAGIGVDFCLLGERGRAWAEKRVGNKAKSLLGKVPRL